MKYSEAKQLLAIVREHDILATIDATIMASKVGFNLVIVKSVDTHPKDFVKFNDITDIIMYLLNNNYISKEEAMLIRLQT